MSLQRGFDGAEPVPGSAAGLPGEREVRRAARPGHLATGTLACPTCDAPVLPAGTVAPADALACPYCAHAGAVRDFLSLRSPARPARVEVRVLPRAR